MTDNKKSSNKLTQELRQQKKTLIARQDWPGVLKVFNQLIEIKPTAERYCNQAFVLLKLGKLPSALQSYQKALDLSPQSSVARKGIAKTKAMMQYVDEKSKQDSMLIQLDQESEGEIEPNYLADQLQQLRRKKEMLKNDHDWAGVVDIMDKIIAIKPTAKRYCNKAVVLQKLGRLPGALESYEKALKLNPDYEPARKGINKINGLMIDIDEATKEEPILAMGLYPGWLRSEVIFALFCVVLAIILFVSGNSYLKAHKEHKNQKNELDAILEKQEKTTTEKQKLNQNINSNEQRQRKMENGITQLRQKIAQLEKENKIYEVAPTENGETKAKRLQQKLLNSSIQAVQTPNKKLIIYALRVLAKMGPKASKAVPVLKKLIKIKNRSIKIQTMITLASIGSAAAPAASILAKYLKSKHKQTRINAAIALGKIGPKAYRASTLLIKAVSVWDSANKKYAGEALRSISSPKLIDKLTKTLQDENHHVKYWSSRALANIGEQAVPAITNVLKNSNNSYVKKYAILSLAEIGPKAKTALPILKKLQQDIAKKPKLELIEKGLKDHLQEALKNIQK